jgi:hypothetical protein
VVVSVEQGTKQHNLHVPLGSWGCLAVWNCLYLSNTKIFCVSSCWLVDVSLCSGVWKDLGTREWIPNSFSPFLSSPPQRPTLCLYTGYQLLNLHKHQLKLKLIFDWFHSRLLFQNIRPFHQEKSIFLTVCNCWCH